MIVVDTSALMAILLDEPEAEACMAAMEAEREILISAGTVAEALIVARRRNVGEEMAELIHGMGFDIVSVTSLTADNIANAYDRWGKGVHRAALNLGDCFAYALAVERGCALLYVGGDFGRTDIGSAL
ncbi:MAG: type II toxin-antitoxin system VapC family toxin [Mesorhizobium sp.]